MFNYLSKVNQINDPLIGDIKDQLLFFIALAKPLIYNLKDQNDKIKANAWLKKIQNDQLSVSPVQIDYIKLFLMVLQCGKLSGPFAGLPDMSKPLEPLPKGINLKIIVEEKPELTSQSLRSSKINKPTTSLKERNSKILLKPKLSNKSLTKQNIVALNNTIENISEENISEEPDVFEKFPSNPTINIGIAINTNQFNFGVNIPKNENFKETCEETEKEVVTEEISMETITERNEHALKIKQKNDTSNVNKTKKQKKTKKNYMCFALSPQYGENKMKSKNKDDYDCFSTISNLKPKVKSIASLKSNISSIKYVPKKTKKKLQSSSVANSKNLSKKTKYKYKQTTIDEISPSSSKSSYNKPRKKQILCSNNLLIDYTPKHSKKLNSSKKLKSKHDTEASLKHKTSVFSTVLSKKSSKKPKKLTKKSKHSSGNYKILSLNKKNYCEICPKCLTYLLQKQKLNNKLYINYLTSESSDDKETDYQIITASNSSDTLPFEKLSDSVIEMSPICANHKKKKKYDPPCIVNHSSNHNKYNNDWSTCSSDISIEIIKEYTPKLKRKNNSKSTTKSTASSKRNYNSKNNSCTNSSSSANRKYFKRMPDSKIYGHEREDDELTFLLTKDKCLQCNRQHHSKPKVKFNKDKSHKCPSASSCSMDRKSSSKHFKNVDSASFTTKSRHSRDLTPKCSLELTRGRSLVKNQKLTPGRSLMRTQIICRRPSFERRIFTFFLQIILKTIIIILLGFFFWKLYNKLYGCDMFPTRCTRKYHFYNY